MTDSLPNIYVDVDPTNPGQFFACCGLLELADRYWRDAEGWFDESRFSISTKGTLNELIPTIACAKLSRPDKDDEMASPLLLDSPFQLRLDWWQDELTGGKDLKVWAGSMEVFRIARAMQLVMQNQKFHCSDLFNVAEVVYDADGPKKNADRPKKVEPFYFDARRAANAHSRDVGFSPDALNLTTMAYPAVEFLCLVGLQRCLPAKTDTPRIFDYYVWTTPLPPLLLPVAVVGLLPERGQRGYRFENWYRTGQKKHKAFRSATPISK